MKLCSALRVLGIKVINWHGQLIIMGDSKVYFMYSQ